MSIKTQSLHKGYGSLTFPHDIAINNFDKIFKPQQKYPHLVFCNVFTKKAPRINEKS